MPRRSLCAIVVAALAAVLLQSGAASAADGPHVVVWSGGLAPAGDARGVELRADGSGRLLRGKDGSERSAGAWSPKSRQREAIRDAASRLLRSGPAVTHAGVVDGGYVSVLVEDGGKRRAVVDSGRDAPGVARLLKAVNATLPASAELASAGSAADSHEQAPAPCPPGQHATDITKNVSMKDAAFAGLVHLKPKGAYGGDSIAVDGTWKPVTAPAKVKVRLELTHAPSDHTDWASEVAADLRAKYANYAVNGMPVTFEFDVVSRSQSDASRACYHQIYMHDNPAYRSYVREATRDATTGQWGDDGSWAHEVGHLLGIGDHYTDVFRINGYDIPLPRRGLEGDALQAALPKGVRAADGLVRSVPWKNWPPDLMATGSGRLLPSNLAHAVAGADIVVHDSPGDVLVNKQGNEQNMIVGAPFELRIPANGKAHVDGLVAYCMDMHRRAPVFSPGMDVAGPAGALGGEAMEALQRVADVVAARQPAPLAEVPGATDAFWRVTDDADATSNPDAVAILQAAGVPPAAADKAFAGPHFDPASAAPETGAAAMGQPVSGTVAPAPAPDPAASKPSLSALSVAPRRVRARKRVALVTRVTVTGAPETVRLSLTRKRGRRTTTVARGPAVVVEPGQALLTLVARKLKRGKYTLVATGAAGGTRTVSVVAR